MKFSDFKAATWRLFSDYLMSIYEPFHQRRLSLAEGFLTFPSIILFTETESIFIAELAGYSSSFRQLAPKTITTVSIGDYFSHFSTPGDCPTIELNAEENGLQTLIFTNMRDISPIKEKYHFDPLDRVYTVISAQGSKYVNVGIGPNFRSAFINDCYVLNQFGSNLRMRHILHSVLINKQMAQDDYIRLTRNRLQSHQLGGAASTKDLLMVSLRKDDPKLSDLRSEYISLLTIKEVPETTLGLFLASNPALMQKAFGVDRLVHERELEWQEGNPNPQELSIRPDFFLQRRDGFYDILDLKTPKWESISLTKGDHKRRRFVDYVNEGIAQLANYEDYFKYPKNRSYAQDRFGITVKDPNLYLVVGNYDNLPTQEKLEALRSHKPSISILDYETVNALASL